jgi:hypothetical protein
MSRSFSTESSSNDAINSDNPFDFVVEPRLSNFLRFLRLTRIIPTADSDPDPDPDSAPDPYPNLEILFQS